MKRKFLSIAVATSLLAPACAALAYPGDALLDEAAAAGDSGGGAAPEARDKAREAREKAREEREKAREGRDAAREQTDVWRRWAEDYARDIRGSMGTAFAGHLGARTVKGAPYSANVVTEVNQALADGNVISRRTEGAMYRDGDGRTRQESGGEGKEKTIFIRDPVDGKQVVLAPGSKKAVISSLPHPLEVHADRATVMGKGRHNVTVFRTDGVTVRIEDGKVFKDGVEVTTGDTTFRTPGGHQMRVENGQVTIDGKLISPPAAPVSPVPPTGPLAPVPPEPPHLETRIVEKNADGSIKREEVRVQVVRSNHAPMPPIPPIPPAALSGHPFPPMPPMPPIPGIQSMRFESTARLGKGVTANLGMRDFEGVKAEGKSTTWTIPAGEIGNRKPIDIVSESWYSPDLQVTVYSRYNDPRTGETVYRLTHLKRGEPSAELFKVPEDAAPRPGEKEKRAQ